ncbi:hypothetical protein ABIE26_001322 [Pedobacter africanus]|uniref:Uncharacterized protein n=1 Tax=Pedobacter africanus TaxID=151894 RepID=A0ACC6KSR3_9SPHI|nr:protein-disulfide reductase DsbD domain-containing protein [Pedobacter africanus]MDR6782189.1 hypothetical protein [Pedobacter africanus]
MKRITFQIAVLLLSLCCFVPAMAQKNGSLNNLSVLYVGGSANWENDAFKTPEDKAKDVQRRMASFEAMLKQHFSNVKVVDAKGYTQDMSNTYDVTVIDGTPKPIAERQMIKDAKGNVTKYIPPAYLTESFNRPVVFIGETGEKLGRSIGLKLDWYCLCLDAYAHSFRKEHPIFKGPFPVKMTIEQKATPEDAFHYEYFMGKPTPKTLPMWRVQTKGYVTDKGFRIGMVARPWGFEDSPDAESISSGVCAKTLDAVALGRHGNFFHWGFAASPEYMTAEAQNVLANAIVYISKFKDKGVIARKYLDRRATKEYLKERKYLATKEAFDSYAEMDLKFDQQMLAAKKEAEEKKVRNEKLTEREEQSLSYQTQPKQTFEGFLKKNQKELFNKFSTNSAAYLKYYDENKDYFYSEDASYVITVDEDVKSLGIPNTDKRLLEKCIAMLEKGQDTEKAKRILGRYTLLDYKTAGEWRNWYEKNKSKIFFTETGGYYFMVNSYDKDTEGNNYKKKSTEVSYNQIKPAETNDNNAVSVATGIVDKGANKEVVVKVRIHPGYHIYAFVADVDPYTQTAIKISLPEGYAKVGDLKKPSFKYFSDSGTTIYEDEIMFTQEISGSGKGAVTCAISYQCCDTHICFPPVNKSYEIQI